MDMDDTLCSLVSPAIQLAKKLFGRQLKLPTYGRYMGWFGGQLSDKERAELLKHVCTPEFYVSLPANFSMVHHGMTVQRISEIAHQHYLSVSIITARQQVLGDKAEDVTREWLGRHGFKNHETVPIHTPDYVTCKTTFCDEPTVMVDDSVSVADGFGKDERHRVLLIDQPWNSGHPISRYITRTPVRQLHACLVRASENVSTSS